MTNLELTFTEENYIKAIYSLSERSDLDEAATNQIAKRLHTKPPTVSDMLKKLAEKKLISYEKYKKVQLTKAGRHIAISVIRKHRLWEVFLHEKLDFAWDEVHDIAEQLEHIHSEQLILRLEKFLGFPKFDPHGDPIPSADGKLNTTKRLTLSEMDKNCTGQVVGVNDSSSVFLQYLQQLGIGIGSKIKIIEKIDFDGSVTISIKKNQQTSVSKKFADNVLVSI